MPNEKEMKESQAAQACLVQMILECRRLFLVPKSVFERYYMESGILTDLFDPPVLNDLGAPDGNYRTYLLQRCKELLKVRVSLRISCKLALFANRVQTFFHLCHGVHWESQPCHFRNIATDGRGG